MHSLAVLLVAIIFSLVLTPLAKLLSFKYDILDHPGHRKIHAKPIPILGGLAIFASFVLTSTIFLYFDKNNFWILLMGAIFVLFGFIDDLGIKVRARYKIWSHLLFSFLLVLTTGLQLHLFPSHPLNWIVTACFITFMTNSFNMLDGMDGLLSGVSALASIFIFFLAVSNGQKELAWLSLIVVGACLGFLRYNFNPASIFLGEAGSTFLGYIMAVQALRLNVMNVWDIALLLQISRVQLLSFLIPLIILGIPIFDSFFVFANRFFNRVKLSKAGKDHSYHRIHVMGLSQKHTVLCVYAIQGVLGSIALCMVNATLQQFFALLFIVMVLAVFFWIFLVSVKVYANEPSQN